VAKVCKACEVGPYTPQEVEIDEFQFNYSANEPPHIKNDMVSGRWDGAGVDRGVRVEGRYMLGACQLSSQGASARFMPHPSHSAGPLPPAPLHKPLLAPDHHQQAAGVRPPGSAGHQPRTGPERQAVALRGARDRAGGGDQGPARGAGQVWQGVHLQHQGVGEEGRNKWGTRKTSRLLMTARSEREIGAAS
jgi:hypothetical protein